MEFAAVELVRSWQNPEFIHAFRWLQTLPDRVPPEDLRSVSKDAEDQAFTVAMMYEGVGMMVSRGMLPLEVVDDLMGGATRVIWRKLERWVAEWRTEHNPRAYEWLVRTMEREEQPSRLTDSD